MTPCNDYTGCQGGADCTCGGGPTKQAEKPKVDPISERLAMIEAEVGRLTTKEEMDSQKDKWEVSAYMLTNEGRKGLCALLREARELLR